MDYIEKFGYQDENPETELIRKEENNPCIDCPYDSIVYRDINHVQDYCYYDCKCS
jgi:hypothetical protein